MPSSASADRSLRWLCGHCGTLGLIDLATGTLMPPDELSPAPAGSELRAGHVNPTKASMLNAPRVSSRSRSAFWPLRVQAPRRSAYEAGDRLCERRALLGSAAAASPAPCGSPGPPVPRRRSAPPNPARSGGRPRRSARPPFGSRRHKSEPEQEVAASAPHLGSPSSAVAGHPPHGPPAARSPSPLRTSFSSPWCITPRRSRNLLHEQPHRALVLHEKAAAMRNSALWRY